MTDTQALTQELTQKLENIQKSLTKATAEAKAGKEINLTALSLDVQLLAKEITALPKDQAKPVENLMKGVLTDIDRLYDLLKEKSEGMAEELRKMQKEQQVTAYQKKNQ